MVPTVGRETPAGRRDVPDECSASGWLPVQFPADSDGSRWGRGVAGLCRAGWRLMTDWAHTMVSGLPLLPVAGMRERKYKHAIK